MKKILMLIAVICCLFIVSSCYSEKSTIKITHYDKLSPNSKRLHKVHITLRVIGPKEGIKVTEKHEKFSQKKISQKGSCPAYD